MVRQSIAGNRATPDEIREALLNDPELFVRKNAIEAYDFSK